VISRGRQLQNHGSETGSLAYALHVLCRVLPMLSSTELKTTAAATLEAQLLSRRYNLPDGIWQAVSLAKETGQGPSFVGDDAPATATTAAA
jgi:hypothetical protein